MVLLIMMVTTTLPLTFSMRARSSIMSGLWSVVRYFPTSTPDPGTDSLPSTILLSPRCATVSRSPATTAVTDVQLL